MFLTNTHKYQENYVTKTKLINHVIVISVHEQSTVQLTFTMNSYNTFFCTTNMWSEIQICGQECIH